ncbi:MAG: hypothetical protein KJO72_06200 [Gammaproteobacteria bacterium]|nr:hypothetical protein [Gammaproteobacteria bacterium]
MDNPTTLLVAIMFVTVVVTGIVSILMSLSELVTGHQKIAPLQANWLIFLLLTHLNYFWNTTLLLEIEGWTFLAFTGFIIGPIVLLFATNMAIAMRPEAEGSSDLDRHFLEFSGRFFLLLFLVQMWLVGVDFSFDAVDYLTYLAGLAGLVFLLLMLTKSLKAHAAGAVLVWIGLLIQLARQSFG